MSLRFKPEIGLRIKGRIMLSHLLEMPEREFEKRVKRIEKDELFKRLLELGVLKIQSCPRRRLFARLFDGRELQASREDLPTLMDGQGDLARLISRIGRERFETCFLSDGALSNEERAEQCRISVVDARRLREFVDRLYVRSEFEGPSTSAPATVYSAVAGIAIENGHPVIGFFNRDIWKSRYEINKSRLAALRPALSAKEFALLNDFLKKAELLERRKTTLCRTLELLVEEQAEYLKTGDPDRRRPLTQRRIAARIGAAPSVLNRVIANKSFEAPWGLEIPLKSLFPSRKTVLRDRLYDVAMEHPRATDPLLSDELFHRFGVRISPRSITQYRKELNLPASLYR